MLYWQMAATASSRNNYGINSSDSDNNVTLDELGVHASSNCKTTGDENNDKHSSNSDDNLTLDEQFKTTGDGPLCV